MSTKSRNGKKLKSTAEKYYITNGDQFVGHITWDQIVLGVPTNQAARMKKELALSTLEYIQENTDPDVGNKWCVQKYFSSASNKNYVVTNATKYVGSNETVVDDIAKAKSFKTAADAEAYTRSHGNLLFDMGKTIIINEEYYPVDMWGRRIGAWESAKQISINRKAEVKKVKRSCLSKSVRIAVYQKDNGICQMCGKPVDINEFTVDHIVPLDRGGINDMSNYRCLCGRCNKFKGNSLDEELVEMLKDVGSNYLNKHPGSEMMKQFVRMYWRGIIYSGGVTNGIQSCD